MYILTDRIITWKDIYNVLQNYLFADEISVTGNMSLLSVVNNQGFNFTIGYAEVSEIFHSEKMFHRWTIYIKGYEDNNVHDYQFCLQFARLINKLFGARCIIVNNEFNHFNVLYYHSDDRVVKVNSEINMDLYNNFIYGDYEIIVLHNNDVSSISFEEIYDIEPTATIDIEIDGDFDINEITGIKLNLEYEPIPIYFYIDDDSLEIERVLNNNNITIKINIDEFDRLITNKLILGYLDSLYDTHNTQISLVTVNGSSIHGMVNYYSTNINDRLVVAQFGGTLLNPTEGSARRVHFQVFTYEKLESTILEELENNYRIHFINDNRYVNIGNCFNLVLSEFDVNVNSKFTDNKFRTEDLVKDAVTGIINELESCHDFIFIFYDIVGLEMDKKLTVINDSDEDLFTLITSILFDASKKVDVIDHIIDYIANVEVNYIVGEAFQMDYVETIKKDDQEEE